MNTFTLRIQDAAGMHEIEGVTSFVGEDASGSFGIMAGHACMITCLVTGLARYRVGDEPWRYVALAGAVLYFYEGVLTLSTRRSLLGDDYALLGEALAQQLRAEEEKLHVAKQSLRRMEEQVLKRLWETARQRP